MVHGLWSMVSSAFCHPCSPKLQRRLAPAATHWLATWLCSSPYIPSWSPCTSTKNGHPGHPCQLPSAKNKILNPNTPALQHRSGPWSVFLSSVLCLLSSVFCLLSSGLWSMVYGLWSHGLLCSSFLRDLLQNSFLVASSPGCSRLQIGPDYSGLLRLHPRQNPQ